MTYTPAYNAQFGKPLVNQLIAIIQRDQQNALAIVNARRAAAGNAALDPIAEFHKGPVLHAQWPCLFVRWDGEQFAREAEFFTRHQTARIDLILEVGQFDQEMAMEDAADYGSMLDIIVTTASTADWETPLPIQHETAPAGTTTPNASGTVKECFVESHTPQWSSRDETELPVLAVRVPVLFELDET